MIDHTVDTKRKVLRRKKRRDKFRKKTVRGLNVDVNGALSSKQKMTLINKLDSDQQLSELQHMSPIIWVMRNISTEKSEPMKFKSRPYLVDIYKDFSEHIVVKKGAQIGLTQLSIAKCLYVADTQPVSIIYTFPTAADVSNFSKTRFKPIISGSKYLTSRIKDYDSAGIKQLGDSTIYFKGTWVERQGISVPSDINIHDELDFSTPDVRDVYSARLSVSKLKWEWDFSTPTLPDTGIDSLYKQSDQHVWIVQCLNCGKEQEIKFFKNIIVKNGKSGEDRFFFGCRKCGKKLNRTKGSYVAKKPERSIRGYKVPQTICPVISARYMVREYKRLKKRTNGIKTFHNFNLGETYESGENRITRSMILDKVVPGTVDTGKIAIGADQGDVLHVEVCKLTDKRRIIEIVKLRNIPELVQMIRHYEKENTVVCVLDALPNHNEAKRYAERMYNLYLCYYDNISSIDQDSLKSKIEEKEVHVSRSDILDHTAAEWQMGDVLIENYINQKNVDEFTNQMTNMKRDLQEDKRRQKLVPKWIPTGPDHYRHADAYSWIASELLSSQKSNELVVGGIVEELSSSIYDENIFKEDELW